MSAAVEVERFAAAVGRLRVLADDLTRPRPHVLAMQTRQAPALVAHQAPAALRPVCRCGRGAVELAAVDLPDTLPPELPADPPSAVLICAACDDGGYWTTFPLADLAPSAERARALALALAILRGETPTTEAHR